MFNFARQSGLGALLLVATLFSTATAAEADSKPDREAPRKRLLLLGQGPDGHPWSTHEYKAGMRILAQCLQEVPNLQTILVSADEPWTDGPELIDGADGVVLFLSQGAYWIHQDAARLDAFKRLAARGGGFVGLHWGMGCRDAQFIEEYVKLVGGCHGGPDRKFRVLDVTAEVVNPAHPVMQGIDAFEVHEEFYFALKFARPESSITPLLKIPVDGRQHTVAWVWERPAGGRSFGFSGGHFHENWELEEYRRLLAQAVLWTLEISVPGEGLSLEYSQQDLKQPRPKP